MIISLVTILMVLPYLHQQGDQGDVVIELKNSSFQPEELIIETGESVTWKNESQMVHTVTCMPEKVADEGNVHLPEGAEPFNSRKISPGGEFSHKFTVPGEYKYFCIPHEALGMVGEIIVKEKMDSK